MALFSSARSVSFKGLLLAAVSSVAMVQSAHAEAVDYNSLETLFGEPVTMSATGKPQKASEVPVGLDIVTDDQIRRMGVTSLPEVLGRLPGMVSWNASRSFADVGIRGQNTPYNSTVLVLVNGRQVYADSSGFTDWSLIPVQIEEIAQIEVVKGPATALYGFNALSGVVNIITHNPRHSKLTEAGAVLGTGDYWRGFGIKSFALSDDAQVRISASSEAFNEYSKNSKTPYATTGEFQDMDSRKVVADGLVALSDKTDLRLETSYAETDGVDPILYTARKGEKSFLAGKATLSSETDIGLVEANLYTNIYRKTLHIGANESKLDNQIIVAQLQDLFKVGANHTFRAQTEFRHNSLQSDALIGVGAEVAYDVASIGGMWNWAITPELEWTNALRLDTLMLSRSGAAGVASPFSGNGEFDKDLMDYGANSGLVWKASNVDTLRAAYGRGIRAPSLFELGSDYRAGAGTTFVVGNPHLGTTVVDNYEIGYDRHIEALGGAFKSSLFYKQTEDLVTQSANIFTVGPNTYQQAATIGNTQTMGLELGLNGTFQPEWSWDVSYIYQNTVDSLKPDAAAADPSSVSLHFEDVVPHHVMKAHLGYATGPWEADVYGEVGSSFDGMVANGTQYRRIGIDGYHTVGGRVGYTFANDVTLALMGSDLSQARVANTYGLENERRVFLSLSKKF